MALIVEKFGGSSVGNMERLNNVAQIIAAEYKKENRVVVVVSAQGDTTDDLLTQAREITQKPDPRELDALLASGEQMSSAKLAMLLIAMGVPAVSLCGWQTAVHTDGNFGYARIKNIDAARVLAELDNGKVVVAAGFQGMCPKGNITTIGRGGSDTTAVALAAVLKADICRIYTDVDGVYSADPRLVTTAVKHYEIGYDEMLELASQGAQILHNRSVEMAKRYGVQLEVLSSIKKVSGTKVREVIMEQKNVTGVAIDRGVALVRIVGIKGDTSSLHSLLYVLADKKINVDMILKMGAGSGDIIELTVPKNDMQSTVEALCLAQEKMGFTDFKIDDSVCKITIVGAGMANNYGIAARMLGALEAAHIEAMCITTSETKISLLVPAVDGDKGVIAVHDTFF